jgi:hypothetical protein
MSTYYSQYAEIDLNVFFSPRAEININNYVSNYSILNVKYFNSSWAEITIYTNTPGGILAWTKTSPALSNANACKLYQTIEATIPFGNPSHQINHNPEFVFQNIIGESIFTQNFKSPSVYINDVNDPRVASITNEILSFIFGDEKFNEEKYKLQTQYIPQKIVASKKQNGKIAGYCYFNDNNVYAFEINDEANFSSSSSSSYSSITISEPSQSSSSSTKKYFSSLSSQSSLTSKSSASSSSLSTTSTSSSSSENPSSSSSSRSSISSSSTESSRSTGSSSSASSVSSLSSSSKSSVSLSSFSSSSESSSSLSSLSTQSSASSISSKTSLSSFSSCSSFSSYSSSSVSSNSSQSSLSSISSESSLSSLSSSSESSASSNSSESSLSSDSSQSSSSSIIELLPKTGQVISYAIGDDGYYQSGIPLPNPRFTVEGLCVRDNFTNLMWTIDVNVAGVAMNWYDALDYCESLSYGGYDDWRMPNAVEMRSLMDYGNTFPALPTGHPFIGEELTSAIIYHTGDSMGGDSGSVWGPIVHEGVTYGPIIFKDYGITINLDTGSTTNDGSKLGTAYVWPVRG